MIKHTQYHSKNAYEIRLGTGLTDMVDLYISYDTVMAVSVYNRDKQATTRARLTSPSRTTSRHLSLFGVWTWPEVTPTEMDALIRQGLTNLGLSLIGPAWAKAA